MGTNVLSGESVGVERRRDRGPDQDDEGEDPEGRAEGHVEAVESGDDEDEYLVRPVLEKLAAEDVAHPKEDAERPHEDVEEDEETEHLPKLLGVPLIRRVLGKLRHDESHEEVVDREEDEPKERQSAVDVMEDREEAKMAGVHRFLLLLELLLLGGVHGGPDRSGVWRAGQ